MTDRAPPTESIETVGLVHLRHYRLLLVRSRGKGAFYLPGGKPVEGEDDVAALCREVFEELGTTVMKDTLRPYGVFEDRAYGMPEPVRVRIACYFGELYAKPTPCAEIEELGYFSRAEYEAMCDTAPAVRRVLHELQTDGLVR